ncbi:glycosyltransferase family 4 protein [Pontiella agarivorans]|uniref:Glycosyltransferase family 4 protein n=1 Tax=Pontiella agarivorans TaxID=3038953 RepID=A0ABU5MUW7_9BACT|nr:glycosyltransferase family 4 protein [Pontiella agarivorans]MDZ8117746.1 glycosyltransferase family 4 protein [Pontiella agarivorans]
MKVIHICQRDDPDSGGSLRVAEALGLEQRAAGVDVWVLFLYGPRSHVCEEFKDRAICLNLDSSKQAFRGVRSFCSTIRKVNPDIIHSHDGIIWPRLAIMQFRIPVVMHSHLPLRSNDSGLGRFLVKHTTKLLVGISLHTIDSWVEDRFPPSRIHYVPNGVDFQRFKLVAQSEKKDLRKKLNLPEHKRILLWVGRVHRSMKGSDRVERVARLLPDDTILVVVGNGPEYAGMLERCSAEITAGRLIMAGSCSMPENYYKAADEFLFTSYHEPFGLVILEAVASGLPITAFPVTGGGGAVCLLQEFDALMLEDDAADDMLTAMLQRSEERSAQVLEHRARALEIFSWGSIVASVMDVYKIALIRKL